VLDLDPDARVGVLHADLLEQRERRRDRRRQRDLAPAKGGGYRAARRRRLGEQLRGLGDDRVDDQRRVELRPVDERGVAHRELWVDEVADDAADVQVLREGSAVLAGHEQSVCGRELDLDADRICRLRRLGLVVHLVDERQSIDHERVAIFDEVLRWHCHVCSSERTFAFDARALAGRIELGLGSPPNPFM
jgi:hypothetical protein